MMYAGSVRNERGFVAPLEKGGSGMDSAWAVLFGVLTLVGCAGTSAEDDESAAAGRAGAASGAPSSDEGCQVVDCGTEAATCCRSTAAGALGNELESYAPRLELLESISVVDGAVVATFAFVAAGQQGTISFDLDTQYTLARATFIGRSSGAVDPFLTAAVEQRFGAGCAFAFDLQARLPAPELGSDIEFTGDQFCYGGGVPGQGSRVVLTAHSSGPGSASLSISRLELVVQ